MTQPFQPICINHPGIPATAACARCGQPYCDSCLVEFLGSRYCGPCRNLRLVETQGAAYQTGFPGFASAQAIYAGTGRVDISRWISQGWNLLFAEVGTWVLATLIFILLGALSCGLAMPALLCGMYLMAFRQIRGERIALDQLFGGFTRFANALGLGLLVTVPVLIMVGVGYGNFIRVALEAGPNNTSSTGALSALIFLYALYPLTGLVYLLFYTVAFFSYPRIAATNVSPIGAISESWEVVKRNPGMFLLLVFVLGLIYVAGGSVCQILLLFALPLIVLAVAQGYVDHFGLIDAELG